jgi:hypothetical protein
LRFEDELEKNQELKKAAIKALAKSIKPLEKLELFEVYGMKGYQLLVKKVLKHNQSITNIRLLKCEFTEVDLESFKSGFLNRKIITDLNLSNN